MIYLWLILSILVVYLITDAITLAPYKFHTVFWPLVIGSSVIGACLTADSEEGFFIIIKLLSAGIGSWFFVGMRFKGWWEKKWACLIGYVLLFINISEAVVFEIFDIISGGPMRLQGGSYINSAAGLTLLLCMPYPRHFFVSSTDSKKFLRYGLDMVWVIVYTIWNFGFAYGTCPPGKPLGELSGLALIHLITPLLLMRKDPALYLQSRTYSLTMVTFVAVLYPHAPLVFKTAEWYHPVVPAITGPLAFSGALLMIVKAWKRLGQAGNPPGSLMESGICCLKSS